MRVHYLGQRRGQARGCVLYEMLAGEPPFVAGAPAEVLSMHLYMPVPEVRAKAPDTPDALAALVTEMLSKDAARRTSAAEVLRRLQALATTGDVRTSNLARTRESRMIAASPAQPSILEPQVLAPARTTTGAGSVTTRGATSMVKPPAAAPAAVSQRRESWPGLRSSTAEAALALPSAGPQRKPAGASTVPPTTWVASAASPPGTRPRGGSARATPRTRCSSAAP